MQQTQELQIEREMNSLVIEAARPGEHTPDNISAIGWAEQWSDVVLRHQGAPQAG